MVQKTGIGMVEKQLSIFILFYSDIMALCNKRTFQSPPKLVE